MSKIKIDWKRLRPFALATPFVLATIGYLEAFDGNPLQSLYSGLRIYGLNIDIPHDQINPTLEVARWLAIPATASIVMLLFSRALDALRVKRRLADKEVFALHGAPKYTDMIHKELGKRALLTDSELRFRAKRHILAFEDDRALLRYVSDNSTQLLNGEDERTIFLCTHEIERSRYQDKGVIISNMAENCARLYWRQHWLRADESCVAVIGFGSYGERLLEQALLVNVFEPESRSPIHYHVFGEFRTFRALHEKLGRVVSLDTPEGQRDSLEFHSPCWEEALPILRVAHRIILCCSDDNLNILVLNKLLHLNFRSSIHIRIPNDMLQRLFVLPTDERQGQIVVFGHEDRLYSREVITQEKLIETAKLNDAWYNCNARRRANEAHCHACSRKDREIIHCQVNADGWKRMDAFRQGSNIAAADHLPVKLRMLLGERPLVPGEGLCALYETALAGVAEERRYALSEAEHIRWMRYHFLHNWDHADIPRPDHVNRLHPDLVPFARLPPEKQALDWDQFINVAGVLRVGGLAD